MQIYITGLQLGTHIYCLQTIAALNSINVHVTKWIYFSVIKCTYNQNNRDIFIKEHVSDVRANDRSYIQAMRPNDEVANTHPCRRKK